MNRLNPHRRCFLSFSVAVVLLTNTALWAQENPASPQTPAEKAQALLTAEKWPQAIAAFEALTEASPDDPQAWFGLAQARHGAGDYGAAVVAYGRAADAGFSAPRTLFQGARALAAAGRAEEAVARLGELADTGAKVAAAVRADADLSKLAARRDFQAVLTRLTPCSEDEFHQFDFWLGEWDVVNQQSGATGAINRISAVHGGCALHEQYENGAYVGSSLNGYDATTGRWYQFWSDNQGTVLRLMGEWDGKSMVMQSAPAPDPQASPLNRISWTPNQDGTVRQHWETSTDDGKTWTTAFDGLYTKKGSQK
ncbi:MAG: tetratricopeptide repeat protein [Acidobacteriota bacterium]